MFLEIVMIFFAHICVGLNLSCSYDHRISLHLFPNGLGD